MIVWITLPIRKRHSGEGAKVREGRKKQTRKTLEATRLVVLIPACFSMG